MDCKDAIRKAFEMSDFLVQAYLGDFVPQEMLVRPLPNVNHAAWQVGHLISAEWQLVEAAVPGSMPKLPAGFAERHSKDTSVSDKPADFLSKEEYFKIAKDVRAGTLAALDKLSPADLDKPVSGKVPPFVTRAGESFLTAATHWTMHSGQWAVLRRKLGRPVQF